MQILANLLLTLLLCCIPGFTYAQSLSLELYPQPQQIVISNQQYVPSHGYTLQGISNPDADAVKILKEALPFVQSGKSLPLEVKKLKARTPEMERSGAYILDISKKKITIEIVDDRSLFYAAQTLKQLSATMKQANAHFRYVRLPTILTYSIGELSKASTVLPGAMTTVSANFVSTASLR